MKDSGATAIHELAAARNQLERRDCGQSVEGHFGAAQERPTPKELRTRHDPYLACAAGQRARGDPGGWREVFRQALATEAKNEQFLLDEIMERRLPRNKSRREWSLTKTNPRWS